MNHHPDTPSVRPPSYLHEHMFPSTTTESPARRSLSEFLRDALGTAIEFATLGEATLDADATAKLRYVRAEDVALAPVPLPVSLFGTPTSAHTGAGTPRAATSTHAARAATSARTDPGTARTATSAHTGADTARAAASTHTGADNARARPDAPEVIAHPHRLALARPVRPRRPGAVPPRPPVCTAPVAPAILHRQPTPGATSSAPAVSHRHTPSS